MKQRIINFLWRGSLLILTALAGGCTQQEAETPAIADGEALVMHVMPDGQPAAGAASRSASDHTLREDYVETLDVFFLQGEEVKHYVHTTVDEGRAVLMQGNWKQTLTGTYDIYAVANMHDAGATPTAYGTTDPAGVKTRTQLLFLTDTDPDIARAEDERSAEGQTYAGKKFLMDGMLEGWNADSNGANATISLTLYRAAAKINVTLTYSDAFLHPAPETTRTIEKVEKKLVRYVTTTTALATGTSVRLPDVTDNANATGFSAANITTQDNGQRKDVLYAYSYANDWAGDISGRETCVMVNIPYTENGVRKENYYKIPLRLASSASEHRIERNMEYRVRVTVDRTGSTDITKPEKLTPTYTIAPWTTRDVSVDNSSPNYLMVEKDTVEMNNVASMDFAFFSSSPITATVTKVFFIDKTGKEVSVMNQNPVTLSYPETGLSGKVTVNAPVPDNVTPRYIEVQLTNREKTTHTVQVIQYPLEYIMGVPGTYSRRDDGVHTEYEHFVKQTIFTDRKPGCIISEGEDSNKPYYEFQAKWYNNSRYIICGMYAEETDWFSGRYKLKATAYEYAEGQNNNRMYLVQMRSTSSEHIVARPAMEYDEKNDQPVTASNAENNQLVSPFFMLASQLGVVLVLNGEKPDWTLARSHCKHYVEYIVYDDGSVRCLDDWRLPTEAELTVVANYQDKQPDIMDKVMVGLYYWTALKDRVYTVPNGSVVTTGVRCIRDVSPADIREFRAHHIR